MNHIIQVRQSKSPLYIQDSLLPPWNKKQITTDVISSLKTFKANAKDRKGNLEAENNCTSPLLSFQIKS